ncbi:endothelin-converting enzyme 1-like [Teleopsis dalmanni]|uniref:endothelin-converting enzyme 1-like n=1 Tax=Teleopsis dalmanni TaxID=139649 RepID=UPI0018CD8A44|nr:endothelin-converting enzyme 1-like [Teleopsis dalmanni]XP_037943375.1 endothelin-converting enzyme 1-like [Teleopsis dalmanni]
MNTYFQAIVIVFTFVTRITTTPITTNKLDVIQPVDQLNSSYVRDIMRLSKAAEIHNYMNGSIDPCDNFYNFACGNWLKINPANSIQHATTGFFESITLALNRKVALVLKSGVQDSDTETDIKVKKFYESCTNIAQIQSVYRAKLKEIIAEFGEMPALVGDKWQEQNFNWLETVGKISLKYGKDIIISIDVLADYAKNTENRVYIGPSDLPLESRSMYLDNVTKIYREGYKMTIADKLKRYLGINEQVAKETAADIMDFEISLARGMIDDKLGLDLDEMTQLTTIDNMQKKYAPDIDIRRLLDIRLGSDFNETIYEFVPEYQDNLKNIIIRTPKRVVANYIFYYLLSDFQLKNAKTRASQEVLCIAETKSHFAKVMDNMIYRKYNTKTTEMDIELVWNKLKSIYRSKLRSRELNWIDLDTRKSAIEKLDAMKLEINSYTKDDFTKEFANLTINGEDYVENVKSILSWGASQLLTKLHEPPKSLEAGEILSYTPANIIIENTIKVPISLLQPYYLWAAVYPNALKFATLGTLVGHEMVHGFDDSGRKYDKDGNSRDWWDELSTKTFVEKTKCFSKQYSKYIYGGRNLPKSTAQSENIADNGGIRLAYEAYLNWYEDAVRSGQDLVFETLPTLNYTSKQLFFITYAQLWCSDTHPRLRDLQTSVDSHVPSMFRVIGPLSNFLEFSKEFNCEVGTQMNPLRKCAIY